MSVGPFDVTCPTCGAPADWPCEVLSGDWAGPPHDERIEKAASEQEAADWAGFGDEAQR